MKETIKLIQQHLGVTVDGIAGQQTWGAIANALNINTTPRSYTLDKIPTQAEVRSGKSVFGKAGCEKDLVNIKPPYQLYYEGKPVGSIRVHKLIADRVEAALKEVLDYYGIEAIKQIGLDKYSGSYNYRKTTNGKAMSMHAWGIALDFDAARNGYRTKKPHAALSAPVCNKWWDIWEKHGAVSLGRERNVDWMHLQFAKLK